MYAVQRAAKTSSSEAIVLAVMVEKDNLFSLAMLTGLAEYLSCKSLCQNDHTMIYLFQQSHIGLRI